MSSTTEGKILDPALIKDLSNHIYEKRKATAFQIESITKNALARNDSQTIYRIINELADITTIGTNSAKLGAITALGSVSVALGSFAIAYFLEDIIKPIFATFRDTDARVRYYACESLYNIAKIARGEILLYFNEVFDILCILVTDSESSVKNAADILDRLVKDIVSAKSTNYVSILQQQHQQAQQQQQQGDESSVIRTNLVNNDGSAIQVNNPQDPQKAFSLPKFIPTLLERIYVIDPFAKKFLLSWIELFDDIPSLELISFLPNFLEPLINFLFNNAPSDVRLETENLLNALLKEIKSISKIKFEVKKRQIAQERAKKKVEEEKKQEQQQKKEIENGEDTDRITKEVKEITLHPSESVQDDIDADADDELDENASIRSEDTTIIRKPKETKIESQPEHQQSSTEEDGDEFLFGQDIFIDYAKIINILLSFLRSSENETNKTNSNTITATTKDDMSNEPHEICCQVQSIALKWLREILVISPVDILKSFPECVSIVMKNISTTDTDRDFELRDSFLGFNLALQDFLTKFTDFKKENEQQHETDENENDMKLILGLTKEVTDSINEVELPATINAIIRQYLDSTNELSRVTALEWLIFIYSRNQSEFLRIFSLVGDNKFDLTDLLKYSNDSSNDVILKVLQLLAKISESNQVFFKDFIIKLIKLFEQEAHEKSHRIKVEFIIRKLCVYLNAEGIFTTLSEVLTATIDDLEFINMMVVTLNNILLTSQELASFRKKLKNLDVYKLEDWQLFSSLFQSWCHNAPSALSLCLLTSNYELAYLIIKNLSESEVTFQLLTQLDILIQLLESPIFLKLRLQLLEPEKHPYLYKTLYGLLMVLPQSTTYTTLRNRLATVSNLTHTTSTTLAPNSIPSGILTTPVNTPGAVSTSTSVSSQLSIKRKRVYEMLDKFTKIQDKHEECNWTTRGSRYNESNYESSIIHSIR
ncbi:uncharacterized protein J8A68_005478 [[Candida] subhashii]|uniref:Vacuolar protein 14 C-terminal Fig4-binding domain-containing protein n=1 Tax=[Candida] subhashii TaxID=561895 RepID=A0A8J5QEI1_9ASCO|nr:uncharacterized protein J8A68_005478 [[Candida] subhashii]KAG7660958.1 hypothetical protein J8A68_005478 [[Candida] subhashii]